MKKVLVLLSMVAMIGCDPGPPTSDQIQAEKQETVTKEAVAQVGMPGITRFTEMKNMRRLYELRDKEGLITYTYEKDYQGRLWHLCDSIGYPLPYGTQFSSPQKVTRTYYAGDHHFMAMPQAEPNGLFMPPTAEGTWVQCIGPTGKVEPVYAEDRVTTSPWRLENVGSYAPKKLVKEEK